MPRFLSCLLLLGGLSPAAVFSQLVIEDDRFEIVNTFTLPTGATPEICDLHFSPDGNTAYLSSDCEDRSSEIVSASVQRSSGGDVVGFGTFATVFAEALIDSGLQFGPGTDTFFYWVEDGGIGQRPTGGPQELVAPTDYSYEYGGLEFIPPGYPNAGGLLHSNYGEGMIFLHAVTYDGDGTFTVAAGSSVWADLSSTVGTDVIGDVEILTSGPLAGHALVALYDGDDSLGVFPISAAGTPARGGGVDVDVLASGTSNAWGVEQDPTTGNLWAVIYEDEDDVTVLVQIRSRAQVLEVPLSRSGQIVFLALLGVAGLLISRRLA